MTTHELIKKLSELKSALQRDNEYIRLIERIADRYEESIKSLDGVLKSNAPDTLQGNLTNLKNAIGQTINLIKELSLPKIFTEIEKTIDKLKHINSSLEAPVGGGLENLIKGFSDFQNDFEVLIKGYEATQTLQLISSARAMSLTLKVTVNLVDLMIEKLENHVEIKDNEQALSVLFPSTNEYKDVLIKLDTLSDIYSELCPLFGVSASEYPLRVVKVETGSLWVYIIGHTLVIGFVIWLLKAALSYLYRNFTPEGKILSIPREVQVADSILEFTKKLEEAGVDTTQAKEEVNKAIVKTAQKLNRLVGNQPSVEINDETITVGQIYEEKFLQESKRLLLEDGSQSDETSSDNDEAQSSKSN